MSKISGLLDVLGKDGRGQAVVSVVCTDRNFFQILELLNGLNGTENLLAANLHVVGHVGENCRLKTKQN